MPAFPLETWRRISLRHGLKTSIRDVSARECASGILQGELRRVLAFAPLGHGMRLGLSGKSADSVNRPEGWKVADACDAASGGTLRRGSAIPSNAGPARETISTSPRFRTTRLTEPIAFRLEQRLNEVVKTGITDFIPGGRSTWKPNPTQSIQFKSNDCVRRSIVTGALRQPATPTRSTISMMTMPFATTPSQASEFSGDT